MSRLWVQFLLIAVLAVSGAVGTWWVRGAPKRHVECDPTRLKPGEVCLSQLDDAAGLVWIDARTRAEWKRNGHPDAVLWNLDPAEDAQAMEAEVMGRLVDARRVVVYCGDESCGTSQQVAERVRRLGMVADVVVLSGGWKALMERGVVRDSN